MPVKYLPAMRSLAKKVPAKRTLPPAKWKKSLRPGVKVALGVSAIGAGVYADSRRKKKRK